MNDILQSITQVLSTVVVSVGVPVALFLLQRSTGIQFTQQQTQVLQSAAQQGANLAYSVMAEHGATISGNPTLKNAAIALGVNHVLTNVPNAVQALGKSPADITSMVSTRFGGLLVSDPSVTLAEPPAPTVTMATVLPADGEPGVMAAVIEHPSSPMAPM